MSTESSASREVARRKPFYHRVDQSLGWRQWQETEQGVSLLPYEGALELKDHDVEALPIDERNGSFGGLTTPAKVTHIPGGIVLVLDQAQGLLLCHAKQFNDFNPPFKPLWVKSGLDHSSPYYLEQPVAIYYGPKHELVICDAGKQQLLWLSWPELKVKHIEHFANYRPAAVCGWFDEGYLIGLNPLEDGQPAKLMRLDRSYQHLKPLTVETEQPINQIFSLTELEDGSVLLLRCAQGDSELGQAKVWRLSRYLTSPCDGFWRVLTVEAIAKTAQLGDLKAVLPALQLLDGQLHQPQHCSTLLLEHAGVDRQGLVRVPNPLAIVAVGRRIRMQKSRRLISSPIASDSDQFSWDRLVLETVIVENTSIVVQSKTSDRLLTDEELTESFHQPWSVAIRLDAQSSPQLLIQSLPGRYLYLSLSLYGDGHHSSKIDAINIEGPRTSALQWLGPVYHQDRESRHFLDRFLSYFDTVFDEIGYQADHFARYLSPGSCPDEGFIDWLAGWFDWQFVPDTALATKRQIISELMSYYRRRGTMAGLKQLLRWYTGLWPPYPQIIEHYVLKRFSGTGIKVSPDSEDIVTTNADKQAFYFSVYIPQDVATTAAEQERLWRLVNAQKPAHTEFRLRYFAAQCVVGQQATIGLDMVVGSLSDHRQPPAVSFCEQLT